MPLVSRKSLGSRLRGNDGTGGHAVPARNGRLARGREVRRCEDLAQGRENAPRALIGLPRGENVREVAVKLQIFIPAQAGIQCLLLRQRRWVSPAGMTD